MIIVPIVYVSIYTDLTDAIILSEPLELEGLIKH